MKLTDRLAGHRSSFLGLFRIAPLLASVVLAACGSDIAGDASSTADDAGARTKSIIFFGLTTLLLLAGTPWPGMRDSRPLFRFEL